MNHDRHSDKILKLVEKSAKAVSDPRDRVVLSLPHKNYQYLQLIAEELLSKSITERLNSTTTRRNLRNKALEWASRLPYQHPILAKATRISFQSGRERGQEFLESEFLKEHPEQTPKPGRPAWYTPKQDLARIMGDIVGAALSLYAKKHKLEEPTENG